MSKLDKYLNEGSGKSVFGYKGPDEVGKFWVVTFPTQFSSLNDIFFEADIFDFALQLRGGLEVEEISGIFKNKAKAKKLAVKLLEEYE